MIPGLPLLSPGSNIGRLDSPRGATIPAGRMDGAAISRSDVARFATPARGVALALVSRLRLDPPPWGYPHKAPLAGRGCAVPRPACESGTQA